ncbi:hypothetical protein, partial [Nitrosomonas nitrosa]|uniref:hypothetical protein n=1 Tax=Nitrosomonas nitrosa TaxID=52442 RepID=UPI001C430C71
SNPLLSARFRFCDHASGHPREKLKIQSRNLGFANHLTMRKWLDIRASAGLSICDLTTDNPNNTKGN